MKYYSGVLIFLLSFFSGSAQSMSDISGTVRDSVTAQVVEFASVSLVKSSSGAQVQATVSDAFGVFTFEHVPADIYKIIIGSIGYKNRFTNVVTVDGSKAKIEMGTILLSPESKVLGEVVIEQKAQLVSNKIDKIVYSVEKDVTAGGGNATDVLRKVPLVSVDNDGNVSVRGDSNVRILINGKATGAGSGNLADVLRTIPADQIKNIEVMANPSAKYDAEGSAGVINIVTKQKSTGGISGSVSGGIGTRQNNFNANLNYNVGKFSLSANLGLNNGWPQTSHSYLRQAFDSETVNTVQETRGQSRSKRQGVNPSINLGYELSDNDNISTGFRYNDGGFENEGNSASTFTDNLNSANNTAYSAATYSKFGWKGFDWNADYKHKFSKPGHEFTFSSQWSNNHMINRYSNDYTAFYNDQRADSDGSNNEYTFQADYSLPVTDSLKIEAGGKTILRRFKSDFTNFVPGGTDAGLIYDPENSNLYHYDQDVYAGYVVGTLNLKRGYTLMAGARLEHTGIKGNAENELQQNLEPFTINYETFIPSFTIQKNLSMGESLKLTYSKRITRPSMNFLNPFINRTNIQAQTQGNPDLDPEVSQTVEFSYGSFSQKASINAALYYRNTKGLIEAVAVPLDGESGTIATYQNIGENNSLGLNLFGSVNLFKVLSLRGNFNTYTYKPTTTGGYSALQSQNGTYFQYTAFASGTLNFEKSGISGEVFVIQNSSRRTIQGTNPSFNMLSLGVKKQFWDKKASLGINITSPFKQDLTFNSRTTSQNFSTVNNFSVPFQSFGLTFSYNFGKMQYGKENKSKINNDDMRQDGQGGQGQMPTN